MFLLFSLLNYSLHRFLVFSKALSVIFISLDNATLFGIDKNKSLAWNFHVPVYFLMVFDKA